MMGEIFEFIIFRGKVINVLFVRKNQSILYPAFDVRSENYEFEFSIRYDGSKFVVYAVNSDDKTNLFHQEMANSINEIKSALMLK